MTNLATLWCTNATHFTVSPWSHVVVVNETLLIVRTKSVEHLVHARHRERAHVHHLCLTALEQSCSVRSCENAHF